METFFLIYLFTLANGQSFEAEDIAMKQGNPIVSQADCDSEANRIQLKLNSEFAIRGVLQSVKVFCERRNENDY